MPGPSRRALDAPAGACTTLTRTLMRQACDYARSSERRRVIQPFHKDHGDVLHRMLNAAQPGTYVRPHRHLSPPKPEAFVLLAGAADLLVFDDDGALAQVIRLQAGGENLGVDLCPGPFHSFVVRAPDTVLYEVKSGPYEAASDKDFAAWAPAENEPEAAAYLESLQRRAAEWLEAHA